MTHSNLHPQFVLDESGQKSAVILPMSEYESLMEDIEDLAAVAERREEPTITHEELLENLRQDGLILASTGSPQQKKS